MSTLSKVGFVELAVGALSGWIIVLNLERPDLVKRAGVKVPRRLLQAHLDLIVMGLILIAVGSALPDLPTWNAVAVAFGTIVNPLLFVPLAWLPDLTERRPYRALGVVSFAGVSGGLVAVAVRALG